MSAQQIAAALAAAGFNPPPYIGEEWIDRGATWLPEGHLSIVTITSLGNTLSGWQASVTRRQVDADGNTVESGDGDGVIHVAHLFGHRDRRFFHYERIPAGQAATG